MVNKWEWRQVITVNIGPNSNSLRIFSLFNHLQIDEKLFERFADFLIISSSFLSSSFFSLHNQPFQMKYGFSCPGSPPWAGNYCGASKMHWTSCSLLFCFLGKEHILPGPCGSYQWTQGEWFTRSKAAVRSRGPSWPRGSAPRRR